MIETIYRRVLFVAWALFLGWVCCSQVAGQETWFGKRGNLFEGYASQTPLTKLDPIKSDIVSVVAEVSDGTFPDTVNTALAYSVVVYNWLGGGAGAKGSGTYLGDGLYASAWHVVRENPNGSISVTWKTGEKYPVRIVAHDATWDIVLLEASEKPQGGVPLTHTAPGIGAEVYLAGYSQGPLHAWRGRNVETSSPIGSQVADWMNSTGGAISGDSGGPVLDSTGNYVGPLWGSSGTTTIYSNAGRFQAVIGRFRDRINNWHAQGYGCFGGQCPPIYGGGGSVGYRPPQGGSGRVPIETNPGKITPVQPPAQTPQAPQQPAPPQIREPSCPCEKPKQSGCDCDKDSEKACDPEAIAKAIKDALGDLKGEKGERGLQGPIGPQGPRGPAGEPGQVDAEQIAAIVQEITKSLVNNPALKGEKGDPGERGPEGPRGPGISNISMDDRGFVYVEYGVNGRKEQIGRLQLPEQSQASPNGPAYFQIVPKN